MFGCPSWIVCRLTQMRRVTPGHSLTDWCSRPENLERGRILLAEWSDANGCGPHEVSYGSRNPKRKWDCSRCGEQFEQLPNSRTAMKSGCPACGIKDGTNTRMRPKAGQSLAERYPAIAEEHRPGSGEAPAGQLRFGHDSPVPWKCSVCGHAWNATPHNRTSGRPSGCPECALLRKSAKAPKRQSQDGP